MGGGEAPDDTQRGSASLVPRIAAAVGPPEGAPMETFGDRRKQLEELEARFALQARARTNEVLPGFNADAPPSVLPDYISGSFLSDVLLESENEPRTIDDPPSIYDEYKRGTTRGGVTFGVCIKPGMDLSKQLELKRQKTLVIQCYWRGYVARKRTWGCVRQRGASAMGLPMMTWQHLQRHCWKVRANYRCSC